MSCRSFLVNICIALEFSYIKPCVRVYVWRSLCVCVFIHTLRDVAPQFSVSQKENLSLFLLQGHIYPYNNLLWGKHVKGITLHMQNPDTDGIGQNIFLYACSHKQDLLIGTASSTLPPLQSCSGMVPVIVQYKWISKQGKSRAKQKHLQMLKLLSFSCF